MPLPAVLRHGEVGGGGLGMGFLSFKPWPLLWSLQFQCTQGSREQQLAYRWGRAVRKEYVLAEQRAGVQRFLRSGKGAFRSYQKVHTKTHLLGASGKVYSKLGPRIRARVLCFLVTATRSTNRGGFPHLVKGRHFLFPFSPS